MTLGPVGLGGERAWSRRQPGARLHVPGLHLCQDEGQDTRGKELFFFGKFICRLMSQGVFSESWERFATPSAAAAV